MDKRRVLQEIQQCLAEELASIANDPAQTERAAELHRQLVVFRFFPVRPYGAEDVVEPGALAELELNGRSALYLIVPQGGGLVLRVDEKPVQVITPNSPLGEALMGRKLGDTCTVEIGGKSREYRVIGIF